MTASVGAGKPSAWRLFPFAIAGGLGLVVAVNIGMAVMAHRTAPGLAVQGSFATSNAYGRIQQEARNQVTLGWSLDITQQDGRMMVRLSAADGSPLPAAHLSATASRPMGEAAPLTLAMFETTPGQFRSDIALPGQGQWDVTFVAISNGRSFRHTRRVLVP